MQSEVFEFFATCLPGTEGLLASELEYLRIRKRRPLKGGVTFFGTAQDVQRVCLWSRLAGRITVVCGRVNAQDANQLYSGILNLPWQSIITPEATLAVRFRGTNAQLRNSHFAALKVKDAICDNLLAARGKRPAIDTEHAQAKIEVRLRDSKATVSLDLSGGSLHGRSYLKADERDRLSSQCARAASLLAAVEWEKLADEGMGFFDPSCDEGILVTEAISVVTDQAPSLLRDAWGLYGWAAFDSGAFDDQLAEADERFEAGVAHCLSDERNAARSPLSASLQNTPDTARVSVVGVSASSPQVARAREHLKHCSLRACASIEAAQGEDSRIVEDRVGLISAGRGRLHCCLE